MNIKSPWMHGCLCLHGVFGEYLVCLRTAFHTLLASRLVRLRAVFFPPRKRSLRSRAFKFSPQLSWRNQRILQSFFLLFKGPCLSRSHRMQVGKIMLHNNFNQSTRTFFFPQWGKTFLFRSFCLNRVQSMPFSIDYVNVCGQDNTAILGGTANPHPLTGPLLRGP